MSAILPNFARLNVCRTSGAAQLSTYVIGNVFKLYEALEISPPDGMSLDRELPYSIVRSAAPLEIGLFFPFLATASSQGTFWS